MDLGRALKKSNEQLSDQEQINRASNRMLACILVLVLFIFIIDYLLVIKFIEILKSFY